MLLALGVEAAAGALRLALALDIVMSVLVRDLVATLDTSILGTWVEGFLGVFCSVETLRGLLEVRDPELIVLYCW